MPHYSLCLLSSSPSPLAIDALRDSIKLCQELSDAGQVKTLKLAQYKKVS